MAATAEDMEEALRDDQAIHYLCAEASSLAYKASAQSEISEKCARFNLTDIKYSEVHHSYQGVAFCSEKHKVIIIAHKGTNPENFSDLINDANLAVGQNPCDYASAQEFSKKRREWARTHHANYKIIETGHSLGAVYAELNAIEFLGEAITFESPGIKAIKQTLPSGCKITTYLAAPNPINTCNGHIGEIIRLYVPHIRKEDLSFNNPQEVMQALKSLYDLGIRFIANPQQVVVNGVLNLIVNRLKSLPDQMKSYYLHQHSLDAMLNCFHYQRPSLQRKIKSWPSLGEYLSSIPGFSVSFSNFISSRPPFANNYLKQCNVELEMKISSIGTFAAGEIVVIEKGEMKDSEYEDYGSRLLETYSTFYAGKKEFNSLKNQLGYNGKLPELVTTDREGDPMSAKLDENELDENEKVILLCNYKAISLDDGAPLGQKDITEARRDDRPILIKRGDEFCIYGKKQGEWRERELKSLLEKDLTPQEIEVLKKIDFSDQLINYESVDINSSLARVLKKGHDQINDDIDQVREKLALLEENAEFYKSRSMWVGRTIIVAGVMLTFCAGPLGLSVTYVLGGAFVGYALLNEGTNQIVGYYNSEGQKLGVEIQAKLRIYENLLIKRTEAERDYIKAMRAEHDKMRTEHDKMRADVNSLEERMIQTVQQEVSRRLSQQSSEASSSTLALISRPSTLSSSSPLALTSGPASATSSTSSISLSTSLFSTFSASLSTSTSSSSSRNSHPRSDSDTANLEPETKRARITGSGQKK